MSLDNVKHILLILSGKGGVGKSSVTTQLALSLNLAGKSVGILDIDLTGPSIPRLLGLEDAKITQAPGGWNPVRVHPTHTLPDYQPSYLPSKTQESTNGTHNPTSDSASSTYHISATSDQSTPTSIGPLYAASLAFLLPSRSSAVIWRGPKKTAMVRQFLTDVLWPPLDYLLIDTPPGTSDEHIALAETLLKNTTQTYTPPPPSSFTVPTTSSLPHLAGALIVTTPQAVSISDVRKELNFCKKTGIGVVGVVENMSGFVCECCGERTNLFGSGGGEAMAKEFEVRFLGGVPVDLGWGKVVEEGKWAEYGQGDAGGENEVDGERLRGGDDEERRSNGQGREKARPAANGEDPPSGAPILRAGTEKALLVDRYRSCKLCEVFGEISRRTIDIVETPG